MKEAFLHKQNFKTAETFRATTERTNEDDFCTHELKTPRVPRGMNAASTRLLLGLYLVKHSLARLRTFCGKERAAPRAAHSEVRNAVGGEH